MKKNIKANKRNYTYSPSYNYRTKLLQSSNGTNVEERINIEYIENLWYNALCNLKLQIHCKGGFFDEQSRITTEDERRYGNARIFALDKRKLWVKSKRYNEIL